MNPADLPKYIELGLTLVAKLEGWIEDLRTGDERTRLHAATSLDGAQAALANLKAGELADHAAVVATDALWGGAELQPRALAPGELLEAAPLPPGSRARVVVGAAAGGTIADPHGAARTAPLGEPDE